jgi:uncharacterized DUF497 family protein
MNDAGYIVFAQRLTLEWDPARAAENLKKHGVTFKIKA